MKGRGAAGRTSHRQTLAAGNGSVQYRIGRVFAVIIWAELGDPARFSSSDNAVRYTGLDIAVYSSDGKRSGGG